MEFEKVIRDRTSTRSFKDKRVEKELLDKILEAGRIAPTAKNNQPQYIFVVESEEGLSKIDKVSPCRYNAKTCLLVCSNKNKAYNTKKYNSYEMDATIVATHMMLEATNLGVDNIWIRMFDNEDVKREFNLPDFIEPVCILNLGYKTDDYTTSPLHLIRKDITKITEFI